MKALICTASILAFAATANIASADPKDGDKSQNSAAPASQPTKGQSAEQKYCVVDSTTGSRLQRKKCKTRDEWKAEGFDPLNP